MASNATVQLICDGHADSFGDQYLGQLPANITVRGYNPATGAPGVAIGATTFDLYDPDNPAVPVASGTMALTDTTFNISAFTTFWQGGGLIQSGWYHIVTNNPTATGAYVCICSPNPLGGVTNMQKIGDLSSLTNNFGVIGLDFSAWCGGLPNRDCFQITDISAAQFATNVANDIYFTTGDGKSQRYIYVSTNLQTNPGPTSAQWAATATLLAGNATPRIYEIPCNEPDAQVLTAAQLITAINNAYAAIIAVDPTANFAVYCSVGYNTSSGYSEFSQYQSAILAHLNFTPLLLSTHMESSIENLPTISGLREYFNGLASVGPGFTWMATETGIVEALPNFYTGGSIFSARRGPRQRVMFRMLWEQYGWSRYLCNDWPYTDHLGSGIFTYLIEPTNPGHGFQGNIRPGMFALHVMEEALWGTTLFAVLNFGAANTPCGSSYIGSHYVGTAWDTVMLMTDGVTGDNVILNLPGYAPGSVINYWNGYSKPFSVVVDSAHNIYVPVNDLATYVFLAPGSTVTAKGTSLCGALQANSQSDVIGQGTTKNGASATVVFPGVTASFQDVPGATEAYHQTTIPDIFTTTGINGKVVNSLILKGTAATSSGGGALPSGTPSTPISFTVSIDGTQIYAYSNPTAVNYARPSGDCNGASIFQYGGGNVKSTEYWDTAFTFILPFVAETISSNVALDILASSYGGTIAPWNSGLIPQQINIAAFQMFGAVHGPWH